MLNSLDSVEFQLKEKIDFSWLKKYGTAFWSVDQTGSGCVCIGMQDGTKKYFCKIAGVNTLEAEVDPEESIDILKNAVQIYKELEHPNLIKLIEVYEYENFFVAVFEWEDGECLFDHWNFDKYQNDKSIKSPKEKFLSLSVDKRLTVVDVLFSFLQNTADKGYSAVDFYDGSIMYDFISDKVTICDIDLFRKNPVVNDIGIDWYGTKRLKAPEEYSLGAVIDECTNIFTLGAMIFDIFGSFTDEEIKKRYTENKFMPCKIENWSLNKETYKVLLKATNQLREERYSSFSEFFTDWQSALN